MKLSLILSCLCLLLIGGLVWEAHTSRHKHGSINLHVAIVLLASLLAMPLTRGLPGSVTDTIFGFLLTLGLFVAPFIFAALVTITLIREMLLEKSRDYMLAMLSAIAAFIIHAVQINVNLM